jgi:hypothetical protein
MFRAAVVATIGNRLLYCAGRLDRVRGPTSVPHRSVRALSGRPVEALVTHPKAKFCQASHGKAATAAAFPARTMNKMVSVSISAARNG